MSVNWDKLIAEGRARGYDKPFTQEEMLLIKNGFATAEELRETTQEENKAKYEELILSQKKAEKEFKKADAIIKKATRKRKPKSSKK